MSIPPPICATAPARVFANDAPPGPCYAEGMSQIPTKAEILDWIAAHPTLNSKRDIAKAFGIKGAARIDLKRMLKELEAEGHLEKRKRSYSDPDRLPPVSVLLVKASRCQARSSLTIRLRGRWLCTSSATVQVRGLDVVMLRKLAWPVRSQSRE